MFFLRAIGALAVLLGVAFQRAEAEEAPAPPVSARLRLGDDFAAAFGALGDNQSKFTYLGTAVLFTASRGLDNNARDYFAGRRREGDLADFGNDVLGTGVPGALLGLGVWLKGASQNSRELVDFGQAELEAMAATGIVTGALKTAVRRERPDGSDLASFPSGHTSTVAATAMTIYEFYGWRAGVPAFLLTAVTAVGRMSADKHWLSDTVGGAALGVVFGHAFAVAHRPPPPGGIGASQQSWILMPAFDESGRLILQASRLF